METLRKHMSASGNMDQVLDKALKIGVELSADDRDPYKRCGVLMRAYDTDAVLLIKRGETLRGGRVQEYIDLMEAAYNLQNCVSCLPDANKFCVDADDALRRIR